MAIHIEPDPILEDDAIFYEPMRRLSADMRKAAETMSDAEVRYLIDLFYSQQEQRKRGDNQLRASSADQEPNSLTRFLAAQVEALEGACNGALQVVARRTRAGRWCMGHKGISGVLTAGLLASLDITRAPTAASFWRFAGLQGRQACPPPQHWGTIDAVYYQDRAMVLMLSVPERSNPCRRLPHNRSPGRRPAPPAPTVDRTARGCVRTTVPNHAPMARHACNRQPRVAVDRPYGGVPTVASHVPRHSQARVLHPRWTCDPQHTSSPPCRCAHAATRDRPTRAGTAPSPHRLAPPPISPPAKTEPTSRVNPLPTIFAYALNGSAPQCVSPPHWGLGTRRARHGRGAVAPSVHGDGVESVPLARRRRGVTAVLDSHPIVSYRSRVSVHRYPPVAPASCVGARLLPGRAKGAALCTPYGCRPSRTDGRGYQEAITAAGRGGA